MLYADVIRGSACTRRARVRALVLAVVLLVLPTLAADVVRLKDGTAIEGQVIGSRDGVLHIKTSSGTRLVPDSLVADVVRGSSGAGAEPTAKDAVEPPRKASRTQEPEPVESDVGRSAARTWSPAAGPSRRPAEPWWFHFDVLDMHLGWPSLVTASGLKFGVGLPPPYGFGVGTELATMVGISGYGPEVFHLLPLNLYYVPFLRRTEQGRPMPAVYSFLTVNLWSAFCGSEGAAGHFFRAGVGIEAELWKGWTEEGTTYTPSYSAYSSPCAECLTAVLMLLPATLGAEVGWMAAGYGGVPYSSFYVDFKMSFGWHWRRLGRAGS